MRRDTHIIRLNVCLNPERMEGVKEALRGLTRVLPEALKEIEEHRAAREGATPERERKADD